MLSLLIFSRNDTKNALDLAASLLDVADQVVIIDSSDGKEHKELVEKAKRYHKIEVYYALPLGYVEPLRPYGISKCKNEWLLYLDTDERLNDELAKDIGHVISNAKCDVFAIKRYEEATSASHTQFFTWQFRLFRKNKALFKGIIHEQPEVHGKLCTLGDEYFIAHRTDLMRHEKNDYNRMLLFEMLSYDDYSNMMVDYARKFFALDTNSTKGKFVIGSTKALLGFYAKVTLKKQGSEIRRSDYLWFYFLRSIAYAHRHGSIGSISRIWKNQVNYLNFIEGERNKACNEFGITRKDLFEISKKLNEIGVIKYLGLDNPENVDKLTKDYLGGRINYKGISLTIRLIVEKYKNDEKSKGR
ncbi:MAG: hypothetical protein M1360_01295 [Candidatus Marsarchaeota archaeon]|jgi:hypothetical protein|nr:hypothetical protein [Candidatus Marsarchaeota archaeon]MCL5418556.1 hypothetical protein [Candidatus Marsarchaeota archaeon]